MDHAYFKDKISAYSDGALEAQERELIRRHLDECGECRALLLKLNEFSRKVEERSGLSGDDYFENLAQKIESRIGSAQDKVVDIREIRWRSFAWKITAAAASLLLVATVVFYQLRDDSDLPSRMLQDFDQNKEPSVIVEDTLIARRNFEGGRIAAGSPSKENATEGKELAGDFIDAQTAVRKKGVGTVGEKLEKDARQEIAADEFRSDRESNLPSSIGQSAVAPKGALAENEESPAETNSEQKADLASPDDAVVLDDFKASSEFAETQQNTLGNWRLQRDSIQLVLGFENDTVQNISKNKLRSLEAPAAGDYAYMAKKPEDTTQVYQQLANSWYQIAVQTQDTTERNRAIQFLNWYKVQFPADSPMVNQQIQQIPN